MTGGVEAGFINIAGPLVSANNISDIKQQEIRSGEGNYIDEIVVIYQNCDPK